MGFDHLPGATDMTGAMLNGCCLLSAEASSGIPMASPLMDMMKRQMTGVTAAAGQWQKGTRLQAASVISAGATAAPLPGNVNLRSFGSPSASAATDASSARTSSLRTDVHPVMSRYLALVDRGALRHDEHQV